MDRGKVAEVCETHSLHAICSPDTAFFVSVRFNRFAPNAAANSSSMGISIRALWQKLGMIKVCDFLKGVGFMLCCICSPGTVQPARQVPETKNCIYEPAAAGVGASVQAEQVPLPAQAIRSGHVPHADRNAGKIQ